MACRVDRFEAAMQDSLSPVKVLLHRLQFNDNTKTFISSSPSETWSSINTTLKDNVQYKSHLFNSYVSLLKFLKESNTLSSGRDIYASLQHVKMWKWWSNVKNVDVDDYSMLNIKLKKMHFQRIIEEFSYTCGAWLSSSDLSEEIDIRDHFWI